MGLYCIILCYKLDYLTLLCRISVRLVAVPLAERSEVVGRTEPVVFDDVPDCVDSAVLGADADRASLEVFPLGHTGHLHHAEDEVTGHRFEGVVRKGLREIQSVAAEALAAAAIV